VYNDNVVVPTTNGKEPLGLSLICSVDGKTIWRWDDLFSDRDTYIDMPYHHQYNNLLTFKNRYCIDLDKGQTHWKLMRDRSFDVRLNSFGKYCFTYGPEKIDDEYGKRTYVAFKLDIQNGEISEFLTANFTFEHPDCVRGVRDIAPIPGHSNLFLVAYSENLPGWIIQSYFGLYDIELKEWVWDKILITPPKVSNVIDHPIQIVNNKIYAVVDNCIVCHELSTGKQLWRKEFTNDFLFSGFIIEEGRLIANNEDLFAVCLDIETGRELWRVRTAGTSGKMSYLNGIVYFVGGSVPRLFAIEASTGKIVWQINPALLGEGYGARFRTNAVYVLPAKDKQPAKVIALSGLYAYCFEAYR